MYSFFALFFLRKEKRHKRKTSSRIFIPIGSSRAAFSQARKLLGTADGRISSNRSFGQPRAVSLRNLMKRYLAVVCSSGLMWTLPFASFRRTFGANATNYVRGAKRYAIKNLHYARSQAARLSASFGAVGVPRNERSEFWGFSYLAEARKVHVSFAAKEKVYLSPFSFCEKKRGTKEKLQVSALSQSAPLVLLSRKLESYSEPPMVVSHQTGASVSREPFHCGI